MSDSLLSDLLAGLGIAAMERLPNDSFTPLVRLPTWFIRLYPNAASSPNALGLARHSHFLESFLTKADEFWRTNHTGRLKSGPWSEVDSSQQEYHLEASAVCLGTTKILLMESLGAAYEEQQAVLQKVRAKSLEYEHLAQDLQERDIQLQCLIYELSGPLMGIARCLAGLDPATAQDMRSVEIGIRQTHKLEMLVQEILETFRRHPPGDVKPERIDKRQADD